MKLSVKRFRNIYFYALMDMPSSILYTEDQLDQLDAKEFILIKGARVNNLKNVCVAIPKNKLVVITGLSGSGKSSLAFNTLFAEGQRLYIESLSSYARQFLGRIEKPDVDSIRGICPAIAIEQKVSVSNSRSTVGTTTEIYDYMKLLFARIGKTYSPKSGKEVKKDTVTGVVDTLHALQDGVGVMVAFPFVMDQDRSMEEELSLLLSKGFTRILVQGRMQFIEEVTENMKNHKEFSSFDILVDRVATQSDDRDLTSRLADSIQTAFFEGRGSCTIHIEGKRKMHFSDRFEQDGISFEEPSTGLFSFNNSHGACRKCEGLGKVLGLDENLIIPDKSLSVYEGAIAPWRSKVMNKWLTPLLKKSIEFNFPIHRKYTDLTKDEIALLWSGYKEFKGLYVFFQHLESRLHKIQYRVLLSRYRSRNICPECRGTRLRQDAEYVKINGMSIIDLVLIPLNELSLFFSEIKLSKYEKNIANTLLREIRSRIDYVIRVGLEYLTLNRLTSTLSGGELQRIKLATALGSSLVGSMYILDEPSIGLHAKDTARVVAVLKALRNLGNTVIVVEHEEDIMREADQIIDMGPEAGTNGGHLIYQGTLEQLPHAVSSHTANYLTGKEKISIPKKKRHWKDSIILRGACGHNLKDITVQFPLNTFTVVTGVSGSGKSTLINKTLYPALTRLLDSPGEKPEVYKALEGDLNCIDRIEIIDQNPIGKSSRSNPVSYVKAYASIRELYAAQPMSKQRGYTPSHFSFNVKGGRCETCQGEGEVKVEMQFMADLFLTCETCQGTRFKEETREVTYQDKNIADVLDMTVEEAMVFFHDVAPIHGKVLALYEVGMGYVKLGQSSNSLSGGEAQRVKLASFLGKKNTHHKEHILFIFDEPTTGLHFHDISKLLKAINALVNEGHSTIVIEHNMEIIKSADWVIDLGPEGGDKNGGYLMYSGTPESMVKKGKGHTTQFLKKKLRSAKS